MYTVPASLVFDDTMPAVACTAESNHGKSAPPSPTCLLTTLRTILLLFGSNAVRST
jgi:hypothetical protein